MVDHASSHHFVRAIMNIRLSVQSSAWWQKQNCSQNWEVRYWNAVGSSNGVSAHVDGGRGFHLSQVLSLIAERIENKADEGLRAPISEQ